MQKNMNQNYISETKEEKHIEKVLKILHNSQEVRNFLLEIKMIIEKVQVDKIRTRIKEVNSAIRKFRIRKCQTIQDMNDLIGIHVITNDVKQIVKLFTARFPNSEHVDFMKEECIYSPLVYIKKCPPLTYHLFIKEKIAGIENVPIEIRICNKESFISEQAVYYTIYKNDLIQMDMDKKNNLRDIMQHIIYKFALLNMGELKNKEKEKHIHELKKLININEQLFNENNNIAQDVISEFGKLVYKYEHDDEILEDSNVLSQMEMNRFDDKLKKLFSNIFKKIEGDIIYKIDKTIQKMRLIKYKNIKKD